MYNNQPKIQLVPTLKARTTPETMEQGYCSPPKQSQAKEIQFVPTEPVFETTPQEQEQKKWRKDSERPKMPIEVQRKIHRTSSLYTKSIYQTNQKTRGGFHYTTPAKPFFYAHTPTFSMKQNSLQNDGRLTNETKEIYKIHTIRQVNTRHSN